MPETPIPYQNPSWDEQARGVTQSANTPAVPTSSAQSSDKGGSANPVLDSLAEAVKHAQAQVEASAATLSKTPATVQGSSTSPVMPVQGKVPLQDASIHNLDNQHPTTRAGARNKAIGQIAAQAGNVIGNYFKKKEAEKTQQLAQDIHRSMELNEGINQAKQILATDPNNVAAKAQLQKNTTLLNGLLNGKNGKAIGKAYDITFGDQAKADAEKNGKAPEKKAMIDAMKQTQQDRATQMENQLPSQMAPNPAYQQAKANLDQVQKQVDALTKTYVDMAGHVMTLQGSQERAKATTDAANTRVHGALDVQRLKDTDESILNRQKHEERMSEIGAQINGRLKAIKTLQDSRLAGDQKQKAATDLYNQSTGTTKALEGDLEKEMANLKSLKPDDSNYDTKVKDAKDRIGDLRGKIKESQDQQHLAASMMLGDPAAASAMQLIMGDQDQ